MSVESNTTAAAPSLDHAQLSTELAMRRTGMSFQRTRFASDRTLMSVIRTSLSLISFGFTIYKFFDKFAGTAVVAKSGHEPRNFGLSLVSLGIVLLILGIAYHVQFMLGLRKTRQEMASAGFIHGESRFPPSLSLIAAVLLLLIGLAVALDMLMHHDSV